MGFTNIKVWFNCSKLVSLYKDIAGAINTELYVNWFMIRKKPITLYYTKFINKISAFMIGDNKINLTFHLPFDM